MSKYKENTVKFRSNLYSSPQRHFSQQFLPESQGVECLDMGTSRFVWWKLKKLGVLEWKEGSTSYAPSPPDCGMLKRPYFHLRTPSFFNFHQTNLLVPMSKHSTPCDSGRNCWLKWRCVVPSNQHLSQICNCCPFVVSGKLISKQYLVWYINSQWTVDMKWISLIWTLVTLSTIIKHRTNIWTTYEPNT